MDEPRIALAASPRGWAHALHRHVADHGGAVVRATVLHQQDAVAEVYDVFVADDSTSFLTHRLVDELHRRGRAVLGVFDPDDPRGKGELLDMGVDDVIARDEPPTVFLAAIAGLLGRHGAAAPGGAPHDETVPPLSPGQQHAAEPGGGRLLAVAGAGGGTGATEAAVALAHAAARRGGAVVLVDADDVAPAVAQRLGAPLYPNLRAAIDGLEHRTRALEDALVDVAAVPFPVLPGVATPAAPDPHHDATVDVLRLLAAPGRTVVANVGHQLEDLALGNGAGRFQGTRAVVRAADAVIAVAQPTPVGLARLLEWFGEARGLSDPGLVHVLFNRAPGSAFKRQELADELRRSVVPAGVWFAPADGRVEAAAWAGRLVAAGPFTRALDQVVTAVAPEPAPRSKGRRRRARA